MKTLSLTSRGKTTDDVLLALEEATRLISEGVTSGFDRNESGRFTFAIQDNCLCDAQKRNRRGRPITRPTPGPWVYTLDAKGICGIHQANNTTGVPVRIGEVVSNSQRQTEANARLI